MSFVLKSHDAECDSAIRTKPCSPDSGGWGVRRTRSVFRPVRVDDSTEDRRGCCLNPASASNSFYPESTERDLFYEGGPMADTSVRDLLDRVRQGDAAAAEDLVRTYEPEIRRAIRVRMTDARMRRLIDSIDICQSILANFFVRTAAGQYDIQTPEELLRLLVTMARNRVIDWARRTQAERRDGRRDVSIDDDKAVIPQLTSRESNPASVLVSRELIAQVKSRLTAEEVRVMEQRADGVGWDEIAGATGEQPNAVRMRLTRALDRVAAELGLEQSNG